MALTLPDDGYKVPDEEPRAEEKYGDYTLRWSGWHQAAISTGYALGYMAYWCAFREGELSGLVSMAGGSVYDVKVVKEGEPLPEGFVSSFTFAKEGAAELAARLKWEARSNLLTAIGPL